MRYYYAFDGNYNVTVATTMPGAPAERYYYTPYGGIVFLDSAFNALATQQSSIGNAVTFTGRQYDGASGLYLYRNRYYHGLLGTFTARPHNL